MVTVKQARTREGHHRGGSAAGIIKTKDSMGYDLEVLKVAVYGSRAQNKKWDSAGPPKTKGITLPYVRLQHVETE